MLNALIKKQLLEIFSGYLINRKTGETRSKSGVVLYIIMSVLLFGVLGVAFFVVSCGVSATTLGNGFDWMYFALMGLISILLGIFGSVFTTYASLYLPKDNELLMSLPISNFSLVIARTTGVYLTSLMYSALVWIPAMIAYWMMVPPNNALTIIFPIILTFIIALFVSVLSCALGWLVALIVSKTKNKAFITVVLSVLILGLYYVVYFRISKSFGEIISQIGNYESTAKSWFHYVYMLGRASEGSILSMIGVFFITVILAAICLFILSKTFTKIASTSGDSAKTSKKVIGYKKHSVKKALFNREFKHFTSVATWMLNGGFGLIIMILIAVAAIIKGNAIYSVVAELKGIIPSIFDVLPIVIIAAMSLIIGLNMVLTCSISLEGKNLWILQTLPISSMDIIRSKEKMGFTLNILPTLFTTIVLGIVFQISALQIVLAIIILSLYIWLMQDFGLFLNFRHPDLNWTNPSTVVKQGLPVFLNLFGGILFCAVISVMGYFIFTVAGLYVALAAMAVVLGILLILLQSWLKIKGARILSTL